MTERQATLYRMKLPTHECPFGLLALRMLEDSGYSIDEHILTSRDEVDVFEMQHGVATTPQVFIGGKRIGGSEELAIFLDQVPQD